MSTMVHKRVAIIIFLYGFTKCQILETIDREFPDINEMFSFFTKPKDTKMLSIPPNAIVRNISIDLEKIDVEKFRRKLDKYKTVFAKYVNKSDLSYGIKPRQYRRGEWFGEEYVIKTKCLDLMLQFIYMARHKIKQLENERYFNRHDTSYRIAFLYRRLRRIWKKMMDILTTMQMRLENKKYDYYQPTPYLVLHQKAAKLHVDFTYLFWVLVNLHHKYNVRHFIPITTPDDDFRLFT